MKATQMALYLKSLLLVIQSFIQKLLTNYDFKLFSVNEIRDIIHFKKITKVELNIEENIGRKVFIKDFKDEIQTNTNYDREDVLCQTFFYISEFLAKEHPMLGRKGPVCPFVPGSIKMGSLYFSVVEKQDLDAEQIRKIIFAFLRRFQSLEPTDNKLKVYKAMVIVFPYIALKDAPQLIDGVQKQLKGEFIRQGLMIGEFHLLNNSSGLRNSEFYPLRTPYPALAMRHMVASDIAFMTPQECDVKAKISFLQGYIKNFENIEHWQNQVEQAKVQLLQLTKKNE